MELREPSQVGNKAALSVKTLRVGHLAGGGFFVEPLKWIPHEQLQTH